MTAEGKDCLIMGMATNFKEGRLLPFFNSLELAGFKGDLALLINNKTILPAATRYSFNIIAINTEERYPVQIFIYKGFKRVLGFLGIHSNWIRLHSSGVRKQIARGKSFAGWTQAFFYGSFYRATARFALYYSYLADKNYKSVLLTDVNDVVFQGNIFSNVEEQVIYAFQENPAVKLGEVFTDSEWIRIGFGDTVLNELKEEIIYCSGTILASQPALVVFLKEFIDLMVIGNIPATMPGFDQGIYNYMISYWKRPYFKQVSNGDGVLTAGLVTAENLLLSDGKVQLKGSEFVTTVVHQYNRHEHLISHVQNLFVHGEN